MRHLVRYEREDDLLRLTLKGLTNHELREVLVGLWTRLDEADRLDHILELHHYAEDPEAWLSPIALAIKRGDKTGQGIDLAALEARGEKVRP